MTSEAESLTETEDDRHFPTGKCVNNTISCQHACVMLHIGLHMVRGDVAVTMKW